MLVGFYLPPFRLPGGFTIIFGASGICLNIYTIWKKYRNTFFGSVHMPIKNFDPKTADNLMLAYLGDSVFELLVREHILSIGIKDNGEANKLALGYVMAKKQSEALDAILPMLTEEETDVFRRGKNAKTKSSPKSATAGDYRKATGLEVLFGYNHCLGRDERNRDLFFAAFDDKNIIK